MDGHAKVDTPCYKYMRTGDGWMVKNIELFMDVIYGCSPIVSIAISTQDMHQEILIRVQKWSRFFFGSW